MTKPRKKPEPLYKRPLWIIQKVIEIKGIIYKRQNARLVSAPMKRRKEPYQYPTAQNESHKKGKLFLDTFKKFEMRKRKNGFIVESRTQGYCTIESKNAIVLVDTSSGRNSVLARIGLGFEKKCNNH